MTPESEADSCVQSADKKARNMEFAAEWEKKKVEHVRH